MVLPVAAEFTVPTGLMLFRIASNFCFSPAVKTCMWRRKNTEKELFQFGYISFIRDNIRSCYPHMPFNRLGLFIYL